MKNVKLLFSLLLGVFLVSSCSSDGGNSASLNADQSVIKETVTIKADSLGAMEYKFSAQIDSPITRELRYDWTFGDGGISSEATPTHTFPASGKYNIVLNLYDKDVLWKQAMSVLTVADTGSIIYDRLTATQSATNDRLYTFEVLASSADGSELIYEWNFGEGEIISSTQNTIEHTFTEYDRLYNVQVTIKHPLGGDVYTDTIAIQIQKP